MEGPSRKGRPFAFCNEAAATEASRRCKRFLDSRSELKQRGYTVQLCFSHLDRSEDLRPEELIRIDVEVSGTKRIEG